MMVPEMKDAYHMQVTYRAADGWRVIHDTEDRYAECTFAMLDSDEEGALGVVINRPSTVRVGDGEGAGDGDPIRVGRSRMISFSPRARHTRSVS